MAKPRKRLTIQRIANGLSVSVTTATQYVSRGCPRSSIAAVKKWRSENIRSPLDSSSNMGELNVENLRAKLADLLESVRARQIKNARLEQRLLVADEHRKAVDIVYRGIKAHLQGLPDRCEASVPAEFKAVIKQLVEDRIENVLKEAEKDLAEL